MQPPFSGWVSCVHLFCSDPSPDRMYQLSAQCPEVQLLFLCSLRGGVSSPATGQVGRGKSLPGQAREHPGVDRQEPGLVGPAEPLLGAGTQGKALQVLHGSFCRGKHLPCALTNAFVNKEEKGVKYTEYIQYSVLIHTHTARWHLLTNTDKLLSLPQKHFATFCPGISDCTDLSC